MQPENVRDGRLIADQWSKKSYPDGEQRLQTPQKMGHCAISIEGASSLIVMKIKRRIIWKFWKCKRSGISNIHFRHSYVKHAEAGLKKGLSCSITSISCPKVPLNIVIKMLLGLSLDARLDYIDEMAETLSTISNIKSVVGWIWNLRRCLAWKRQRRVTGGCEGW